MSFYEKLSLGSDFKSLDFLNETNASDSLSRGRLMNAISDIWSKLLSASSNNLTLSPTDADELLNLLCTLVQVNNSTVRREEVVTKICERVEDADGQIDHQFLRFLAINYADVVDDDAVSESSLDSSDSLSQKSRAMNNTKQKYSILMSKLNLNSIELQNELSKIDRWDFDIFAVAQYTSFPLVIIVELCLNLMGITELILDYQKFRKFISEIQESYLSNPYHNHLHACDVTQTSYYFCSRGKLAKTLDLNNLALISLIIGAAIHDVGHPGVTGKFLVASEDDLAIRYNDRSPLENMHLATAFRIMKKKDNDFAQDMHKVWKKEMRRIIIELVLATDNELHSGLAAKLEDIITRGECMLFTSRRVSSEDDPLSLRLRPDSSSPLPPSPPRPEQCAGSYDNTTRVPFLTSPQIRILKKTNSSDARFDERSPLSLEALFTSKTNARRQSAMAIISDAKQSNRVNLAEDELNLLKVALHSADVSNLAKPWDIYMQWLPRVMEEFYNQGDREKELNLPVTFAFDREKPVPQAKFQMGFAKAIVTPLFQSFSRIPGVDLSECLNTLDANMKRWESMS